MGAMAHFGKYQSDPTLKPNAQPAPEMNHTVIQVLLCAGLTTQAYKPYTAHVFTAKVRITLSDGLSNVTMITM